MYEISGLHAAFVVFVVFSVLRQLTAKKHSLKSIQGPKGSWLYGDMIKFFYQKHVGDMDFKFVRKYGTAWRMGLPFGEELLVVADPKAINHIMQKSGYAYTKKADTRENSRLLMGRGILWAVGDTHMRHRRIMAPTFTGPHLRVFLALSRSRGAKLSQKWKEEILIESAGGQDLAVNRWLARTTLDIIGEAAFEVDFGALDSQENTLSKAYHSIFTKSSLHPPKWDILFKATWKYLPSPLLDLVEYMPTREYTHFRKTRDIISDISRELVDVKKAALLSGDPESKDIMSILVKANTSEDPKSRLDDEEMIAQMATLTFAGHETTSNTLSWTLYESARLPEFQEKMRAEIAAVRGRVAERGDSDFTLEDLESMTYVNAALKGPKETLRYHPVVYHMVRVAVQDDVIPLSKPIHSGTGAVITDIPVSAGQSVLISVCAYNRLTDLWGEDAHEYNPMRWIHPAAEKDIKVGVYANLMTFSAGVRSCIGWRFAVIEALAILVELIENFKFALPSEKAEMVRIPATLMMPMVEGRMNEGVQMPLHVSAV